MENKKLIQQLGFIPKENTSGIYHKKYILCDGYSIDIDFDKEIISYGNKITCDSKTTQNFAQKENWVVLECVDRLLKKGYQPQNIILEKTWSAGHGTSGRLDICVTREDGSEYLLIECKTHGKEFNSALSRMHKDGGQLFTYFKFSNKPDIIMLYASQLKGKNIIYENEIIKIEDDYRLGDKTDFYEKWNKLTKNNGIFDNWVTLYSFESKALTIKELEEIKPEDSSFIFNRFLEILRHNVVSDKPNAFNKIFTLFLCKIYDEKKNEGENDELGFQWIEGVDDDISFQLRLTDLYKEGMWEFLEKRVTDFSEDEFNKKYGTLGDSVKSDLLNEFKKIRLEKNNEFAIKEVYDEKSFKENARVVKQVVELLQGYKIRYAKKQQYLSDFFEMLLTTGLKQESGQFFTPVPIAQFIIKSLPIDGIVHTKLHEGKRDELLPYIIDYAAGSGHFITESMNEVQRILDKFDTSSLRVEGKKFVDTAKRNHFDWALQYVYGIEKDYRLVKVGKVGCYLHGDGLANVIHSDGLANFNHADYKGKLNETDKDFPNENKQFEVIVSNPPYSVSAFKNAAREYYKDEDFELYANLTDNSSEIECLFIERTQQLLKDGGVAGIILPSSILSNTGIYTKSREIILQYFDIIGITELGSSTFMATGTNTVILFLRRRNNYDSINLKKATDKFFTTLLDVTLNGIEKPITKYVNYVWDNISFTDYITLLQKTPNSAVVEHEIYKEYRKKIKSKSEKEFWNEVLKRENEKLYYFILAYPQKVVLIKSGEKREEKQFLGYEFSNRRGSEGIHPIQRGKSIDECTQLFDSESFDNPKKASTYIYKAFKGDNDFSVDDAMKENVSHVNLVDMFTFDRVDFEKNISLAVKKKAVIESKWELTKLNQLVDIVRGASPRPIREFTTDDPNGINWIKIGDVKPESKYITETKEKITREGADRSRFVNTGDFILSNSMSFGRPYIMKTNGCIHDGWLLMTNFDSRLNKEYFYYVLSSKMVQDQFTAAASGGTSVDNLNIEKVSYVEIPLPPIDIQLKIAAKIAELEKKDKQIEKEIEKEKNEKEQMLLNLFNTHYQYKKLSDVVIVNPSKSELNKIDDNTVVSFIEMASVSIDGYIASRIDRNLSEIKKGSYTYFKEGDIIIAKITPCMENGKCALAHSLTNGIGMGSSEFHVFRSKEEINAKYLFALLDRRSVREKAEANMTGASGHRRVPINFYESMLIPLPSLTEQQRIVSEIEKIEEQIRTLEKQLANIPKQKEAILKKYL